MYVANYCIYCASAPSWVYRLSEINTLESISMGTSKWVNWELWRTTLLGLPTIQSKSSWIHTRTFWPHHHENRPSSQRIHLHQLNQHCYYQIIHFQIHLQAYVMFTNLQAYMTPTKLERQAEYKSWGCRQPIASRASPDFIYMFVFFWKVNFQIGAWSWKSSLYIVKEEVYGLKFAVYIHARYHFFSRQIV